MTVIDETTGKLLKLQEGAEPIFLYCNLLDYATDPPTLLKQESFSTVGKPFIPPAEVAQIGKLSDRGFTTRLLFHTELLRFNATELPKPSKRRKRGTADVRT